LDIAGTGRWGDRRLSRRRDERPQADDEGHGSQEARPAGAFGFGWGWHGDFLAAQNRANKYAGCRQMAATPLSARSRDTFGRVAKLDETAIKLDEAELSRGTGRYVSAPQNRRTLPKLRDGLIPLVSSIETGNFTSGLGP
jgi:hypothetical protein